jgi:hypothetical protein
VIASGRSLIGEAQLLVDDATSGGDALRFGDGRSLEP